VVAAPGTLSGTGRGKVGGKPVCVKGDEAMVIVPGCMYQTPQYSIPGTGTLSIASLAGDQVAQKTKSGGKAVLLKGSDFNAKFQVMVPAMQPPPGTSPPIPDATPQYSGNGSFITTNVRVKGT
jgi:Contractile injection system spike tip protein